MGKPNGRDARERVSQPGKRTSFRWTVKSVRVTDKSRGSERINVGSERVSNEREASELNFRSLDIHSAFYADRCTVDLSCWYADAAHI
jgi:hypothetical protein